MMIVFRLFADYSFVLIFIVIKIHFLYYKKEEEEEDNKNEKRKEKTYHL
jgi:hypothetical protein